MNANESRFQDLLRLIRMRGRNGRSITAIAGPPGAGKSTLAERLYNALNKAERGSAAVFPLDGFHYDDLVLEQRGLRSRKGAPDTFDVAGFAHMLGRLRVNDETEIAVPVFDRSIEIARAGARIIPRSVRHLIVEGNYLLLDREPWTVLHAMFDTTVFIKVDESILRARLEQRWRDLPAEERLLKLSANDIPNAEITMRKSVQPEVFLTSFEQEQQPADI